MILILHGAWIALPFLAGACQSGRSADLSSPAASISSVGLTPPQTVDSVDAICVPPFGWKAEPLKHSARHNHQVWMSPSRRTAYGVIRFSLPFSVGHEMVLWAFMREMKKSEGEANLLSKQWDDALPGIRFVAEGGLYKMRTNLLVRGRRGWAIYAGTLRKEETIPEELDLAERARERTRIGEEMSNAEFQMSN